MIALPTIFWALPLLVTGVHGVAVPNERVKVFGIGYTIGMKLLSPVETSSVVLVSRNVCQTATSSNVNGYPWIRPVSTAFVPMKIDSLARLGGLHLHQGVMHRD